MLALAAAILLRVEVLGLFQPRSARVFQSGAAVELRAEGEMLVAGAERLRSLRLESGRIELQQLGRRDYAGALEIRARGGVLQIVNEVPLEEYVAAVVGSELAEAGREAQAALAVVVRSYALHAQETGRPLCDTTRCQLYLGKRAANQAAQRAARVTSGQVLTGARGIAPALHSADCGGRTAAASEVWPRALPEDLEAGQSVADPPCVGSFWEQRLDLHQLARGRRGDLYLRVTEVGQDGVVRRVSESGALLTGEQFARRLSRAFRGLKPSPRFTVEQLGGEAVLVRGRGHGHGVGFCQCGAALLATQGASWHQLLAFYFPRLHVSRQQR